MKLFELWDEEGDDYGQRVFLGVYRADSIETLKKHIIEEYELDEDVDFEELYTVQETEIITVESN
jgi:hypothetical protein